MILIYLLKLMVHSKIMENVVNQQNHFLNNSINSGEFKKYGDERDVYFAVEDAE